MVKLWTYKISEDGLYIEDVFFDGENLPNDLIVEPVPEGFHAPKWDGDMWIEGLSAEEIEARINVPHEPSEIDKIKEQVADLWEITLFGGDAE